MLGKKQEMASEARVPRTFLPPITANRYIGCLESVWRGPGKLLPQVQLAERIAWILAREFELAARGYMECMFDGTTAKVGTVLSAQAASLVRHILYDQDRYTEQEPLLTMACRLLQRHGNEAMVSDLLAALHDTEGAVRWHAAAILGQVGAGNEAVVRALLAALHDTEGSVRTWAAASLVRVGIGNEAVVRALLALHDTEGAVREQAVANLVRAGVGNEAVVRALLKALHDTERSVRKQAAASLGQVGVGNEVVVRALLEALHDTEEAVRWRAAASLERLQIKDTIQLRGVLAVLNCRLHDLNGYVRRVALRSIRQLLEGRPIPGYRWVPLRKRRARRLRLKRMAFWLGMTALMVMIGLVATWLLGDLNPNGFLVRFLAVLAGIIAFIAAVAQVLGRTLRDPWEHA